MMLTILALSLAPSALLVAVRLVAVRLVACWREPKVLRECREIVEAMG